MDDVPSSTVEAGARSFGQRFALEDYSLLVGTGVILVALASVMYVTRNVNWYGEAYSRGE